MEHNHGSNLLHKTVSVSAVLLLILAVAACLFQVYVRWFINQDFTVIGGWELEALTISGTALLLGLLFKK